ncbi:hypothetical protein RUND412_007635 [Rhizina undulata]
MNGDSYSSRGGDRHGYSSREYHSSDRRDRERDNRRREPRERSRSPHRSSRARRDDYYDGTADRDRYRERDREDRYSSRDRDYERERRRGGGAVPSDSRRERSARYEEPRASRDSSARKRSATPPPKKREPTPDLTDTVPINERKRRMTMWDIKPQGYENVTAEQAKLSGMFPLPGAPRQAPMDPTRLHAFMTQPSSVATTSTLKPTNSRQAKRLLFSGVPGDTEEDSLLKFFNETLSSLNVTTGTPDPVTHLQLSPDRKLGLLEFKNTNDATVCLALSGTEYEGAKLDIKRPKDYIVPLVADDSGHHDPGVISSTVPDTPNKILVSNIPEYLQDEQVIELLKSFGDLKAFVLVKDTTDDSSKGIAFCEYLDPATTDIAVEGLNGMELGDNTLRVQRASIGMKQAAGVEMGVNAMAMMAGTTSADLEASRVLQLLNMVTPDELIDSEEYEEICEDIREECLKFGKLIDMKIPRPSGGSRQTVGVGKIFVRFENQDIASDALRALAGRKFADRTVVCTYFSEENYEVGAF